MNDFLVLDSEFVLDESLPSPPSDTERMPPLAYHRIVCMGALLISETHQPLSLGIVGRGANEEESLRALVDMLHKRRPCIVTWNGRGADLPLVALRCLRYGITFSHYYNARDVRYRYSAEGHLDLMDFLSDFGASKSSKLDVVARLCGWPGKLGTLDGAGVAAAVAAGEIERVRNYCLSDVVQTAGVFLRVQLLRGVLSLKDYRWAANEMIGLVRQDERLRELGAAIDEKAVLLPEPGQ